MNKKIYSTIKILLVLSGLSLALTSLAQFDLSQWRYHKNILESQSGIARFALDDEIFSGANKDLSDLRVVDRNGTETPFKIITGQGGQKTINYSAKMLNSSYIPGQYSLAVFDLGEGGKISNTITISTSSENFQRNSSVYGGNDGENWNVLKDKAYIYDYSDKRGNLKTQNTTINFPDSTWRYLKIEISDDNNQPVKILSGVVSQKVNEKNKELDRKVQFISQENNNHKSTEIIADLDLDGIPVSKISLEASGTNFNRGVEIYSSSDKINWNSIGQGYIFRYNTPKFSGENLSLNFSETNKRYIKVEVLNYDNMPLNFSELRAFSIYREVVFEAKNGMDYRVFYGNAKAKFPQYDLEKYFQYLDIENSNLANLSIQQDNPSFVPEKEPEKPLSERIPYLLPLVLSACSLLLIFLVYRFFKK